MKAGVFYYKLNALFFDIILNMIWITLTLITTSGAVALIASTRTRTAQLARLARANGCTFDKRKSSVTTQLTAGRLEFFTQFFHQYRNVFTCSDNLAFLRIADDVIYLDDKPNTKPTTLTIFTAELKKRHFPLLKIAPLSSPFAPSQYALMKTNIPAIDGQYRIHAPSPAAGLFFTPQITNMLKTRPQIYLELNENALIYHEHTLVPVQDMEIFRFRAMQILGELETLMDKLEQVNPDTTTVFASSDPSKTEKRVENMLRFASSGMNAQTSTSNSSAWRAIGFFVLLLLLLGISFLSWFALRNWVGQ